MLFLFCDSLTQGLPLQEEAYSVVLQSLLGPAKRMTPPDCRSVGKILQGFRSSSGVPSPALAELLLVLAAKIPGWSKRGGSGEVLRGGGGGSTKYSERNLKQKQAAATSNSKNSSSTSIANSSQLNESMMISVTGPVPVPVTLADMETSTSGRSGGNAVEFTLRG